MWNRPLLLSVFLGLIFYAQAFAQYRQYRFERFSYAQGLPYGQVYGIATDTFGFVWFATVGGLFKYDGYKFHGYYPEIEDSTSLSDNRVFAILNDSKGRLWAGTPNGLNLYDRKNNRFIHFFAKTGTNDALVSNHIRSLFEDSQGRIWVGTMGGLQLFDPEKGKFIPFREIGHWAGKSLPKIIVAITEDKQGRIWTTATFGLLKVNVAEKTVERILLDDTQGFEKRPSGISGLATDLTGTIWVGCAKGLFQWLPSQKKFQHYPLPDSLQDAAVLELFSNQDDLWIGTKDRGLVRLNIKTGAVQHFPHVAYNPLSIIDSEVRSFAMDKSGNLWMGALSGASKFNYQHNPFEFYQVSPEGTPNQNFISHVQENKLGQLWMKSWSNEIWTSKKLGDPPKKVHLSEDGLFKNANYTGYVEGEAFWMVAPRRGLYSYNMSKDVFLKLDYGPEIDSLRWGSIEDDLFDHRFLWIYCAKGLCKLDRATKKQEWFFPKADLPQVETNYVQRGYQTSDGKLLVLLDQDGTGLLACFDRKTKKFQGLKAALQLKSEILESRIRQLVIAANNDVWGASKWGLIHISRSQKKLNVYTTKDDLVENDIMAVITDTKGRIWFSSEHYLSRLDPRNGSFWHFDLGDQIHGFISGDALRRRNGAFIFSGSNGIISFHPDSIKQHSLAPDVVLTAFKIRNKLHDLGAAPELVKKIKIKYRDNNLQFEFAGLHFIDPSNNRYRYKLEGFDAQWINAGKEHQATFTNLYPGTYTFRVQAANADGLWGGEKEELRIQLQVQPPWYLTWWFFSLITILLGAAIYTLYRFQLNRKLVQAEASRLREMDQFKTRLYTNITHEFRTPLTVILGMANKIEQTPNRWLQEGVQMIRRNGRNLLRLVNQILELAKLEAGSLSLHYVQSDIIAYLKYIDESFHSLADSKDIKLQFHTDQDELIMDYDPDKLLQIVSNLLSNAIKFTPEGGEVFMEVKQLNEGQLSIQVRDTGIGIPVEKWPLIFDRFYQVDDSSTRPGEGSGIGLALSKELVNLLGGNISVQSQVAKGSAFTVVLPISRHATEGTAFPNTEQISNPTSSSQKLDDPIDVVETAPLVLIVEDNADVVKYLSSNLMGMYRLAIAQDGQEGIDQAIELVPDLIISDVMMPRKDGFELCDTLKNDFRTSHIPIVLLTAKADVSSRITGLRRGADAYLTKPFEEEELLVLLDNLLELRKKLQTKYSSLVLLDSADPKVAITPEMEQEDAFLQKVKGIINAHLDDVNLDVTHLCKKMATSRTQLHNKLKALTGMSTTEFIRFIRIVRAKELLLHSKLNISEIAFDCGFQSPHYFSRVFTESQGCSPSAFREKGKE